MATIANTLPVATVDKLTEMMDKGMKKGDLISSWESMKEFMLAEKVGWYAKALPEFVAISKANRSM